VGRWIGIGIAILALITVGFIVAASLFEGFRIAARDIAIVILAVFQMVGSILTIVLLVAILYAVRALQRAGQDTVMPKIDLLTAKVNDVLDNVRVISDNARGTASNVTSTTVFVGERVVSPFIRISSLVAGARAAAQTLARRDSQPDQG
jgi:tellurite resistance protein TehA-like permease